MVKLGFTGVYIIFLISAQKYSLWILVRTASSRRLALRSESRARSGQLSVSIMWLSGISCQSDWGVIFQWGSTLKESIELPATSRHRRDMTEILLKATLSLDQTNKLLNICWCTYHKTICKTSKYMVNRFFFFFFFFFFFATCTCCFLRLSIFWTQTIMHKKTLMQNINTPGN